MHSQAATAARVAMATWEWDYLCLHGALAHKLGLVMGQHVEILAIYQRHRHYGAFSDPTATLGCSCFGWMVRYARCALLKLQVQLS